MNRAIFLDRDGVLNKTIFRMGKPRAPYTLEEFSLFEGVPEAIRLFRNEGYILIVVTNQPDVARGWVTREAVDAVNNKLKELIDIDDIEVCFHTENDDCACRKPRPGMLLKAAGKWNIDLKNSFMIGDRHSDIQAGVSAHCKTALIGPGDNSCDVNPDIQSASLLEATLQILKNK